MANGRDVTRGKALVGQGRMLAGHSRGDYWSDALDPNRSRLAAGKGAAERLIQGTRMQNVGKQNPYSDLGRYIRTGEVPTQREEQLLSALQPKGGLAQMMAAKGASKKMVAEVQKIEDTPGGKELLYTQAAQEMMKAQGIPRKDVKKVRLYRFGGAVERAYAKGGTVKAAATRARNAGRGEDEMLVHMTEEELDIIKGMWGDPDTNPNTGLPEYGFFSKIWKGIKKVVKKVVQSKIFQIVAPIALSIFVPGLGAAIGGALGASGTAASVIGNALVRGGLSAAGGQGFTSGAISGAISGGLGAVAGKYVGDVAPGLSDRTAEIIGSSLASGAGAELTGGDFVQGALAGATGEMMRPMTEGITGKGREIFGLRDPLEGEMLGVRQMAAADLPETELGEIDLSTLPQPIGGLEGAATPAAAAAGVTGGGDKGQITGDVQPAEKTDLLAKYGMPAILAAGALSGGEYEEGAPPELPPGMTESLPIYEMNRQFQGIDPGAYYTYGQAGAPQSGQQLFIEPDPFAGETGTPTAGPSAGGGAGGMQGLIAAGQPVPANMVGLTGTAPLTQAGYTQDPNTGDWMPPQLGQGLGQAHGGYQQGGEFNNWSQNADVPRAAPSVAASGRYVKGQGTGRSDDIPARLSDGEYVMDAESVALLGDGSGDAGARRLDEMRRNLRKHKAQNLKKGGFSHKAKQPHQYMAQGGMAKLRRAMTAAGRM